MVEGEAVGEKGREGRRGEFRGESEGAEVRREEGVDESERWFEGQATFMGKVPTLKARDEVFFNPCKAHARG